VATNGKFAQQVYCVLIKSVSAIIYLVIGLADFLLSNYLVIYATR